MKKSFLNLQVLTPHPWQNNCQSPSHTIEKLEQEYSEKVSNISVGLELNKRPIGFRDRKQVKYIKEIIYSA